MLKLGSMNPARKQIAKNNYQYLFQVPGEPFHKFNVPFMTAVNEAVIYINSRVDDLFNKIY